MVVADIDDDNAALDVRQQLPRKTGDGLRRNGQDDFCGVDGVENGNGHRADLDRQRGQAPTSFRVRNRDVMTEPGEVLRKCPSHAYSTHNSDSHVDSPSSSAHSRATRLAPAPPSPTSSKLVGDSGASSRPSPMALPACPGVRNRSRSRSADSRETVRTLSVQIYAVLHERRHHRRAKLQQINTQRGDDAANLGGGREVLLKVLDRVCEAADPLVLADQHRRRRARNLTGQSRPPGTSLARHEHRIVRTIA
jgi:hypothetical protein